MYLLITWGVAILQIMSQQVWGVAWDFIFLGSFQVGPMLLLHILSSKCSKESSRSISPWSNQCVWITEWGTGISSVHSERATPDPASEFTKTEGRGPVHSDPEQVAFMDYLRASEGSQRKATTMTPALSRSSAVFQINPRTSSPVFWGASWAFCPRLQKTTFLRETWATAPHPSLRRPHQSPPFLWYFSTSSLFQSPLGQKCMKAKQKRKGKYHSLTPPLPLRQAGWKLCAWTKVVEWSSNETLRVS